MVTRHVPIARINALSLFIIQSPSGYPTQNRSGTVEFLWMRQAYPHRLPELSRLAENGKVIIRSFCRAQRGLWQSDGSGFEEFLKRNSLAVEEIDLFSAHLAENRSIYGE